MVRLTQNSFLGGQLDFELMGRQDYNRYTKGASKLCNFNIMKRGGLQKRQGFDRICNLKTICGISATDKVRLIPFAYTKTQGFILILSALKMYVIGTNPNNIYKLYSVSDGNGVYTSEEIESLDYQQCGDVIFLAQQNHPPAKIEHILDESGEDGFYYTSLNINRQSEGIPSITGAKITRESVNCSGGTYTEKYKVTAVYDGIETFPSEVYYDENCENNKDEWDGTTYYLPFTESQKIRLFIMPSYKTNEDGEVVYPSEIRVYKKAFDYFGLIGVINLSYKNTLRCIFFDGALPTTKYENSDLDTSTDIYSMTESPVDFGNGRTAYQFGEGQRQIYITYWIYSNGKHYRLSFANNTWTLKDYNGTIIATKEGTAEDTEVIFDVTNGSITASKVNAITSGFIKLSLGSIYYTIADDGNSVTFNYKGWTANSITVKLGKGELSTYALPASGGDKTQTITKGEGETAESFETRWKNDYQIFVESISDVASVSIGFSQNDITDTTNNILTMNIIGGYIPINNVTISNYATLKTETFDDKYITPSTSTTPPEDDGEPVFASAGDYPAAVSLTQQRLVWASSKNDPARIWLSQTGDFYTYTAHEIQLPDDPIDFIMPVTRFAKINHIAEMRKLLMFNSACEWLVDSASSYSGITYETIQAYPQSYSGSNERLKPIICNNSLLFSERTGQTVRRFAYDLSNDGFAGRDVSVLSYSIFENNAIVDWTYQQFPFSTLWCVLDDGTMASFEFMEEQDIMAWATHKIGGGGKVKAIATSYSVSPALDEIKDTERYKNATHEEIFAVITRGTDVWLERMRVKSKAEDSVYHALCMDSVRVLNNVNGAKPFEDEGLIYIPKNTTDGKAVTREEAVQLIENGIEVYEGYPFDAEFISCFPVIASLGENSNIGAGQVDIKNIQNIGIRLAPSVGGTIRSWNFGIDEYREEPIRYNDNPAHDCTAEFTGDGMVKLHECDCPNIKLEGINTRDGRVYIHQDKPWAFGLLMYEIDIEPEIGGWNGR